MAKYHISKSGKTSICKAEAGGCPLGGDSKHYDTPEEATSAYEKESTEKYSIINGVSKSNVSSDVTENTSDSSDTYSTSPGADYKETVSLPFDNSGALYRVSNLNGEPTALHYSGAIIEDKEKARKVLEASFDQGENNYQPNPYRKNENAPIPVQRPIPKQETIPSPEPVDVDTSEIYSDDPGENYKDTLSLPGDNSGAIYRVSRLNGVPTALHYSGAIVEDKYKAKKILEASMEEAKKDLMKKWS